MQTQVKIPPEFLCPITMMIMKEPTIMPDGQTYEREAIKEALRTNPVSPLTKIPMKFEDGTINYALKNLIETFLKNNPNIDQGEVYDSPETPTVTSQKVSIEDMSANFIVNPSDNNMLCVNVKVKPLTPANRSPILLIAMIDTSGSMDQDACQSVAGMEDISFSRMQLVQHSLNTVISTLEEQDMISLITFSDRAEVVLKPTKVDAIGKPGALSKVESMRSSGCTNIWDAIRLGIKESEKFEGTPYSVHLMLFTDGEPNINPPMGIIPSLNETLSDSKMRFTMSTFGFGYSVDSRLMEDISRIGNGIYGYCPDCTMVGTIFINFMSNVLTTVSPAAEISIRNPKLMVKTQIGGLYQDVYRNLLVNIPAEVIDQTEIKLILKGSGQEFTIPIGEEAKEGPEKDEILDQYFRGKLIRLLSSYVNTDSKEQAREEVKTLFHEIDSIGHKTEFMGNLLIDLVNSDPNHGQILKSFEDQYFRKWGENYIRSLLRFHIVQQCGNFKDQSLQLYNGKSFAERRKIANKIFLDLQPPAKPPFDPYGNGGVQTGGPAIHGAIRRGRATYAVNQPVAMGRFYNAGGGCFSGNGIVELSNGKTKCVRDLVKGDVLKNSAVVECLVETMVEAQQQVVQLNGVMFTPYHPVVHNGSWCFPLEVGQTNTMFVDKWFNLVLSGGCSVTINGVEAITLGHGRTEGVLAHPYFGTAKVVSALQSHPTYSTGKVTVSNPIVERNEEGMIVGLY